MKVLVIRFSSIGDIVLTTPVIRGVKQQLGAEVHFLTKRQFAPIVEANPYVDRVWAMEKEVTELLPELKAEGFDFVADLHRNLRSTRVRAALRTRGAAFRKLNPEKWLLTNLRIDRLPRVHIVDRYLDTVAGLGVTNDGQGLDYFIPPAAAVDPAAIFRPYHLLPQPYTALVIGAAHATKRLPAGRLAELCRLLEGPVVLLGGPGDRERGEAIRAAAGGGVINTCGDCTLHQSASLVQQAQAVVTHDTGLMHIAAAFQQPVVSIWGNTVPKFGMTPYYGDRPNRNTTVEVTDLSCRPCSKIGYDQCPKGHFRCMQDINLAAVAAAVKKAAM